MMYKTAFKTPKRNHEKPRAFYMEVPLRINHTTESQSVCRDQQWFENGCNMVFNVTNFDNNTNFQTVYSCG